MNIAVKYCCIDGLYIPLIAPMRMTGITFALFARATNGQLTYFIANVLEFIDPNWKRPTIKSPVLSYPVTLEIADSFGLSFVVISITEETNTDIENWKAFITVTLSLRDLSAILNVNKLGQIFCMSGSK